MILVQVLMVGSVIVLALLGLRGESSHRVSASKKLAFCLLMVTVVVAVLFPELVARVAQAVGVGRGTDLVLYVLAMAFGFYVVSQYLAAQRSRNELHRLARRIAVVEAAERYQLSFANHARNDERDPEA
jgi:small membrane protein